MEEAPTEGDRAHREPRPAEGQAGDHIGEPVDTEQHPAAGDADGNGGGTTCEERSRARRAPAGEHEGNRRVERGRSGRVTAWERGAESLRDGVERRAHAVEELLDRVDEHNFADDDGDEER